MLGTSTRSGFRGGCGRASWRPPSDLVLHVHVSGALSGACTGKEPQMANPHPTPKPENLCRPWPPGTSRNPAGHSRGRRISDAIATFGATHVSRATYGATHVSRTSGPTHVFRLAECERSPNAVLAVLAVHRINPGRPLVTPSMAGEGRPRGWICPNPCPGCSTGRPGFARRGWSVSIRYG